MLNEFADRGLRLIEVDKADLVDLPDLIEQVAARPERFVVFCDDLSFDEGEASYKALKSVLDGSVAAASDNVLIYATSNRRHLLPEKMVDNLSGTRGEHGEIHPGEAVEEKISLSERFGLWISFYPFSQEEYLAIAAQWLRYFGVAEAQFQLARMMLSGEGGNANPLQAKKWLNQARKSGHPGAMAVFGNILFEEGQSARGLALMTAALDRCKPKDCGWMQSLQEDAFSVASEADRRTAVSLSHTIASGSDD